MDLVGIASGTFTGTAYPTANKAYYHPFKLDRATTFDRIGWWNTAAVSGNADVGVYDLAGNRLYHSGSTAIAGTNSLQLVTGIALSLQPGYYFLAFAADNTTTQLNMSQPDTIGAWGQAHGIQQQLTAFALPATATFAKSSDSRMVAMFLARRTVL